MKTYYMDLHVHIGQSRDGRPVKITASPRLNLQNILAECVKRKGIDIIAVVDCASPGVLQDLKDMLRSGELTAMAGGGLRYQDRITLYTGVEMEAKEKNGRRAHYLAYFPDLRLLQSFASYLWQHIKNPQLSTQSCYLPARTLLKAVVDMEGLFVPAHAFTPHKSLFGSCAVSLEEVFGNDTPLITALELGLSADSRMASCIPQVGDRVLLSNSDAHSLDKIGREYNKVELEQADFQNLWDLFYQQKSCRIIANYGMDPKLGKYHRSFCSKCQTAVLREGAVLICPYCGEQNEFVTGVLDRIMYISGKSCEQEDIYTVPYHYQIPLSFLPGMGRKTVDKLIARLGSEMRVLHEAKREELVELVGTKRAKLILQARQGKLTCIPGAGGVYGQIGTSD